MDGSGSSVPVDPSGQSIHILSISSLNPQPSLLRNILNINSSAATHEDTLYNLLLISQFNELMTGAPVPVPAPAPVPVPVLATVPAPAPATEPERPAVIPWAERCLNPPVKGTIRLLTPPPSMINETSTLWDTDKSLTDWITATQQNEHVSDIFVANQRRRWLAWKVWHRLTQRIWSRRLQCSIDMIDMAPVTDTDAIMVNDATNRMIYRFHRRDLFNTLLSNICMSEEMLPNPRAPRNPWTNAEFTYGQIVGVCQNLLQEYAKRGRCPPVLFSAFWAVQFDLRRFASENASLLSQHAIVTYFKDINDHNRDTIADTIIQLLTDASVSCSPVGVRRWLRTSPLTEGHREWLAFARDYTLYMNLHVQIRPHWHTEELIYRDVRRLNQQFRITDSAGPRLRALREMGPGPGPGPGLSTDPVTQTLLSLLIGEQPIHGAPSAVDAAMEHIQNSLFGAGRFGGHG
jgi:hypothetical protein